MKEKQYTFDVVFDENSEQKFIYDNTTQFLIDGVVDGFNATVFAYGATGAGKTYTMLGKPGEQGIFGFTFEDLFGKIEEQSKEKDFKIKMSFIEIYNENIYDLFLPGEKIVRFKRRC